MHQNMHTYEHTTERCDSMVTSSNGLLRAVDSTNMPYQIDSEPEPYAVFNQTFDSYNAETMTLPNPAEHQNIHMYGRTIEMHMMAPSLNQMMQTIDSTNMPHQADSVSEPNGDSQAETTVLQSPEYSNVHIYEHTIKMHII